MTLTLLGGVGVFLMGMLLMSDGLKGAAGGALRSVLQRFSRTPGRAVVSGAVVTALVQSSSATTLTTIGFVSAGLLTFPQAVGLIFGANLGTTSTGWLVSILGFKVNLGAVALPVVGIGALLRLLTRGRMAQLGMALAGFGLIFVGIDILQDGMGSLSEVLDPARIPSGSWFAGALLVFVGLFMTVIMQSSSAAVATTLAALHAGGIGLETAALLVVGQNMGTSVTALIASIGGSIPVRRTGVAHALFNAVTAVLTLVLLPLLLLGGRLVAGEGNDSVALALFHTSFNLLGVVVLFPVVGRFAHLVERLVPEVRPTLTRNLDPSVAEVPEVAVEAARRSTLVVGRELVLALSLLLAPPARVAERGWIDGRFRGSHRTPEIAPALAELRSFLARIRTGPEAPAAYARHLTVLHALDHLDRLESLRREFHELGEIPALLKDEALGLAVVLEGWLEDGELEVMGAHAQKLAERRKSWRIEALEGAAQGRLTPEASRILILHAKRLDRLGYHAWRALWHLGENPPVAETPATAAGESTGH